MGRCRIEIWPVDKDGTLTFDAAPGRKYRLYAREEQNFVTNKSQTAFLEYCSISAARRGHGKHCKHETAFDLELDEICDYCNEKGSVDDPVAEWLDKRDGHRLAHGQCGLDMGWRQA